MHLRKIEIIGFKSFADKTTISFEQGVTAIVGPNGCGKSNISDSIRWVLGEKSAKTLRGGKMEDLIFAGTQTRKPMGFAEVSLIISNEDRRFPLDYADVVLTRRLYRSGESEYLLNKTPCRLKDIQDLLMNTGVGSNAYSMVEQGQIDYIVQAKASDRRFLIEEAAGISKYKSKKDEAMRKLARTEHNLERVNDILSEVEKNIKYAERQAKKAERYRQHFDELKKLELARAKRNLESINIELSSIENNKGVLEEKGRELESNLAEQREKLNYIESELEVLENEQHSFEERKYNTKSVISTLRDKRAFNIEKISELENRDGNLQDEIIISQERIRSLDIDKQERIEELESFYDIAQGERDALDIVRNRFNEIVRELAEKKAMINDFVKSMHECEEILHAKRDEFHSLKNDHTGTLNRKESVEQNITRVNGEINGIIDKLQISREEIEKILKDYSETKAALDNTIRERENSTFVLNDLQENLLVKRGNIQGVDSKINALEELASSRNIFKEGTKELIAESKSHESRFFNSVAAVLDVIEVHDGYEHAVQAALADCLYAVVSLNYDSALEILQHVRAKENSSVDIFLRMQGDVNYHELENLNYPGVHGLASKFVNIKDDRFNDIRVILDRVFIVDDLVAINREFLGKFTSGFHIVSMTGEVLTRDGLIKRRTENEFLSGALVQEEQRKKLIKVKENVQTEIRIMSEEENGLRQKIKDLGIQIDALSESVMDKKITLESNEKMSASIKETLAKLQDQKNTLEYEFSQTQERLSSLDEKTFSVKNEMADLESSLNEKARLLEEHNSFLAKKEKERGSSEVEIASLETKCNALKEKEDYLKNAVDIVSLNLENEAKTKLKNEEELATNKQKIIELYTENEALDEKLEQSLSESEDVESVLCGVKEKRSALVSQRLTQKDVTLQMTEEHDAAKDSVHKMNVRNVELRYQKDSINERLLTAYKIDLNEYDFSAVAADSINFDVVDEEIAALQRKVDSLGTVNMLAIEEYDELNDRYTFLSEQQQDLEAAKKSLHDAIRKINKTTKQLFLDVFAMVQKNFKEYYEILFNGGVAELILEDEENPLESGIEIMVRPPGKKLQNLSLLSGGEKALTAVALLFALFKVKPSPFCVLDEVDAPLDEANIDRFLKVVRQFIDSTQFIIVTHNRKTIGIADTLFGVTMQEAGVSKIVSVRVSDVGVEKNAMPDVGETHQFNQELANVDQTLEEIFKEA